MRPLFCFFLLLALFTDHAGSSDYPLKCYPQVLRNGEAFVIEMSKPHGTDIVIQAPGNISYDICWWVPEGSDDPKPIYRPEQCTELTRIEIVGGVTIGEGWNYSEKDFGKVKGIIFDVSGTYRVLMSENMEAGNPVIYECTVKYVGK